MKGFQVSDTEHISALAFADDLILVATEKEDAEALLKHTETYLCNLGMSIAAKKCTSFTIIKEKNHGT
jgi:Reverse transcriptase (RNA-dependent DNA polymerase).